MSSEPNKRHCQKKGCSSEASKHLTWAERGHVTGRQDSRGHEIVVPIYHLDVCDQHVGEAREQYGGHVRALDEECSPDCPGYNR